jgi:hypothetical protein
VAPFRSPPSFVAGLARAARLAHAAHAPASPRVRAPVIRLAFALAFALPGAAWAQEPGADGVDAPGASAPTDTPKEVASPLREQLASSRVRPEAREESANPFRQSVLVLDQSMTTQTVDFGATPQSYVPLYELWLSFRPRYSFDDHWSVRARFDLTKELTNSQPTTYQNEDVFGDVWTDLVYATKLDALWRGTRASLGLRALWPTSKSSQGNGTYVRLGLRGGADHRFRLRGPDAPALNDFHVGVSFSYLHPFTAATTPTSYGGFGYTRQDVDERSFVSDQLTGQTLPEHVLWLTVDAGLQITPRLSFSADLIFINDWHYAPTDQSIHILTGNANPNATGDTQYISSRWFTTELDYELFDELGLSIGYYNLTNALAPDGTQRSLFGPNNIWWSPDARFFFDVTANLDVLFDDAEGRRYSKRPQERAARASTGWTR